MKHSLKVALSLGAAFALTLLGQEVAKQAPVVKQQGYVPFSDAPIHYRAESLDDPIARLQRQLDSGGASLRYDSKQGYLPAVLEALHVAASSQTLVFSKTSFQYPNISPEKPRALYFNDDIYAGRVQQGKLLEFVSFDPAQGAIFYVMDEHETAKPRFERSMVDCVQCHVGPATRGVPGVMLKSVYTRSSGAQAGGAPAFITGQESPFHDRWGGWYVTGIAKTPGNLANAIVKPGAAPGDFNRAEHASLADLNGVVDTSWYLTGTSDVVAHLVLAHQTQMHNLITQTNYQTRLALDARERRGLSDEELRARVEKPAEQLVRYLLFANEAPVDATLSPDSDFAREFASRGPRDRKGRSLRDFDLHRRIFRFPCSYLIYSEAFDAIPEPAKSFVLQRVFSVLTGSDKSPEFAGLSDDDRRAVLEILAGTKPNLPREWRRFVNPASDRNAEARVASQSIASTSIASSGTTARDTFKPPAATTVAGVWKDDATGRTWANSDNGSGVSWAQAQRYCEALGAADGSHWRLPAITELQTLAGSSANAAGYRIRGPLKLTGWSWSSTPGAETGEGWALDFGDGGRASVAAGDSGLNRALCVNASN